MKNLNISNFRDISGYMNSDGKVMKKNKIFRGASLHSISLDEAKYMYEELGIRYILDYRDEKEANSKKDVLFEGMIYKRISALITSDKRFKGFDFGELLSKGMDKDNLEFMLAYLRNGYANMPFNNPAYHKLFDLLLRDDGNIYFHCSAGKDRTGISAFLIMVALGMSEEDAIKEYLLSNKYLESFVTRFYEEHHIPLEYKKFADLLLYVNKDSIMLTIKSIKDKYNSYYEFLEKEYSVDETKRNILKSIYCE